MTIYSYKREATPIISIPFGNLKVSFWNFGFKPTDTAFLPLGSVFLVQDALSNISIFVMNNMLNELYIS